MSHGGGGNREKADGHDPPSGCTKTEVQDFPIRGQAGRVHRRRWIVGDIYSPKLVHTIAWLSLLSMWMDSRQRPRTSRPVAGEDIEVLQSLSN